VAHYAAPNGCCIGCGKSFQANRPRPVTKRKRPAKSNPAPAVKRIGRAYKILYDRDQGNHQGNYFHNFTRKNAGLWTYPPGWAYFPNKVAVIR
jgi:hypothetical protein